MDDRIEKHPLELQDYTIPTQAIEVMVNVIYQWVDILLPGGFIYGHPRTGKTYAVEYIIPEIPTIFGSNIPAYSYICSEKLTSSEGVFYEELLHTVEHALASSGSIDQKRRRFINFLIEAAREQDEYRVILFIDEAQFLKISHYNWLAYVHNKLRKKKIKLIVILVGQYQLLNVKQSFQQTSERQIVSRFMASQHRFCGLQNEDELRRFLIGYDVNSEFPVGSGISYTQYYLPKAYAAGWRLVDQTKMIWNTLKELLANEGLSAKELPMQPLATLAYQLLKELAELDGESLKSLEPAMIEESMRYSCLPDLINYCSAPDTV